MCKKSDFMKRPCIFIKRLRLLSQQSFLSAFIVRVRWSTFKIHFHNGIIIANHWIAKHYISIPWPGSSFGIATDYGLDGPGSIPGRDEIFRPSRPALGPTQPPVQWVPGLSRGWRRQGCGFNPHPILLPKVLEKSRAIPPLTLRACVSYKRVKTYLYCNSLRPQDHFPSTFYVSHAVQIG